MFFVMMTIIANTAMMFVLKYSESNSGNRYGVTLFNYIIGTAVSFILMQDKTLWIPTGEGFFAMGLGAFNGICMTGCLLVCQYCIGKNGAPMTTTFNRLGILIPTVLSAFLFKEIPGFVKIVGLFFAVFAIVYVNGGKEEKKNIASVPSLLLVFVIGGMIDFNSKIFGMYGNQEIQDYFVFWTFVFNTIYSLAIMLRMNRTLEKRDIVSGILVGIPNQLITFCMVRAVVELPAYLVFPIYSAGVILAVNVINLIVFREKLSKRETTATVIIGFALFLINL